MFARLLRGYHPRRLRPEGVNQVRRNRPAHRPGDPVPQDMQVRAGRADVKLGKLLAMPEAGAKPERIPQTEAEYEAEIELQSRLLVLRGMTARPSRQRSCEFIRPLICEENPSEWNLG